MPGLLAEHLAKINNGAFLRSEWKLRLKKSGTVSVDLTSGKMKDGRYIAFGRDLTEQHRAEQELRDRERQLARVIAGSDQGFWDWNLETNRFQVSPRWESMLGYGPARCTSRRTAGTSTCIPKTWSAPATPSSAT
ncbi:Uncharacterised protein [Chromobacterium violaceum]|uniref:Uncharacterized protein n=1 Tax=Chromobacterium violaceum TaxID=536 RepID=A0A447TFZ5_CHRVL|nr:Uncharacterised protein [Chromobacterium violaceum]